MRVVNRPKRGIVGYLRVMCQSLEIAGGAVPNEPARLSFFHVVEEGEGCHCVFEIVVIVDA